MSPIQNNRRRRKAMADINVVPYIDVMLVLLVVFMVAAPLLTQGVKVDLPKESSQPIKTPEEPVIVSIKTDGSYWFKHGAAESQSMPWEILRGQIETVLKISASTQVLVESDKKNEYGEVMHLMTLLQQAGVEHVGLVTNPEDK